MRKLISSMALMALPFAAMAYEFPAGDAACDQSAEPARWASVGTPDIGAQPPVISAHRGGVTLAPENTLAAYEIAFAYGMDVVEVDVRETLDGRFFSMHDGDAARTTDGTGMVDFKTAAQIAELNAAHFEPWMGGEYDPSPVPFLEDILALAERTGRGIEFDIKSVRNYPAFLLLVAQYPGVYERSFLNVSGLGARALHALQPRTRFIFNLVGGETPQDMYDEAGFSTVFGSQMQRFTPELIAAIHDGCGVVMPHTYDEGHENEGAQYLLGRAMGIDGAQVDQPDVIRAAMNDPVPTKLVEGEEQRICLVNAENELGLPYKKLELTGADGKALEPVDTAKGGCAVLPKPLKELQIAFAGDATAQASELKSVAVRSGRFGGALGAWLLLPLLGAPALRGHRRIF